MNPLARLGPVVRGLMRTPASPSSGSASSVIGGAPGRVKNAIVARSGLKLTAGVRGASTSAASSGAGVW